MNYLLKPEVMAGITNAVRFPNGNAGCHRSWTKTSPATRHLPADEVKASCTRSAPAAAQREMTRSWTKIKSGK
jgi:putrescine transport system substrate-binding protein